MCAKLHVNLCVLGANIHVNVGVRGWMWLNVRESSCESVCGLFGCVRILMCISVFWCKFTCDRWCSLLDVFECARLYM